MYIFVYQNNSALLCEKYKTTSICFDIALVRYEDGFNSTFGLVVFFLITKSCNPSCYIKTRLWFCICLVMKTDIKKLVSHEKKKVMELWKNE